MENSLNGPEKPEEQRRFEMAIGQASQKERDEYFERLSDERIKLSEGDKSKPIIISFEKKNEILDQAMRDLHKLPADPTKMGEDWEKNTTPDGRPPIGGAQND